MANWEQFCALAPELAAEVRARFEAHRHKTMATVRADGSPRICGTEVELRGGEVYLGGMSGNRRFADLRRDPRVALHSGSDDPPTWSGDAKLSGRAVEITAPEALEAFRDEAVEVPPGPFELFRVELTEASVVRLAEGGDHLLIDLWQEGQPVRTVVRR
ncbi:MAG TPA: pyridoxamine 5'-phosphate oxidase family protein [Kineosporiaceae bacterium]|nr:pyridoxamine 5'-phosphate oxidase family protein [Kineosporiaceae bacterium]